MNGATAHLLVLEESPAQVAQDRPERPVETALGEAVASAAIAIAAAVEGCLRTHTSVLDPELKIEGGNRLAKVAELQLAYMGDDADFVSAARLSGRRALRRYFDDSVNPHLIDAAIDRAIDPVLEIVSGVVKTELIYRIARSS